MTTLTSPPTRSPADALVAARFRRHAQMACVLGAAAVLATAFGLHVWLETTWQHLVIAVAVFITTMGVMLIDASRQHPFPRFGPANRVTLLRAGLAAIVAGLIMEPARSPLAIVAVITAIAMISLDGVDGWLARRTGMSSAFGARFDMETDAFFILVLSVLAWRYQKAGLWVVAIGMMRYLFVVAGSVLPRLARPLPGTVRGKTVAITQSVALAFALLPLVPVSWSRIVCASALALLTWSFALDVVRLWQRRDAPDVEGT